MHELDPQEYHQQAVGQVMPYSTCSAQLESDFLRLSLLCHPRRPIATSELGKESTSTSRLLMSA